MTPRENTDPLRRDAYDRVIEALCILALLFACFPLVYYNTMEDAVFPIHFNARGEADGWGGRGFLVGTALAAVVSYVVLTLLERLYRKFRYPMKVTEENAPRIHRLGVRMMRHIKLLVMFVFACMSAAMFYPALFDGFRFSASTVMWPVVAMGVCVGWYCLKMRKV